MDDKQIKLVKAEAAVLESIREWLKRGAVIFATDLDNPILEMMPNGSCNGGISIWYPPDRADFVRCVEGSSARKKAGRHAA